MSEFSSVVEAAIFEWSTRSAVCVEGARQMLREIRNVLEEVGHASDETLIAVLNCICCKETR